MDLLRISKSTGTATRPLGHLLRWARWHADPQARRAQGAPTGAALSFYSHSADTLANAVRFRERI
jgi:hypothetical protein